MTQRDHSCDFESDGLRCPKLGIFTSATLPGKDTLWYCRAHRKAADRSPGHATSANLHALGEDVRSGRESRGTCSARRETDAMVRDETRRLGLSRGPDETALNFVSRCKASMKFFAPAAILAKPSPHQVAEVVAAGEDAPW